MRTKLLFFVAICAPFAAAPAARAATSPAFQADALHDGFVSDPKLMPPLKLKWQANVGSFISYPVVADGLVVFTAGATLYALRASDGKEIWSAQSPSGTENWVGAAYDKGRIFAQAELAVNYQPSLFAFEAKSGKALWSTALEGQYSFSSPPTAANGLVYTGGAGTGGTVYAFEQATGKLSWTGSVENGDDSSPVVDKTDVYVSYACPQTYDFNAKTGAPVWHYNGPCEGGGGATAVLNGGLLFVEDSFLDQNENGLILNASTGAVVSGFNSPFVPAFGGGAEFLIESGQTGEALVALNPATQSTLWSAPLSGGATFTLPPFVVDNVVYAVTSAGALNAYAAASGSVIASYTVATGSGAAYGMGAGSHLLLVPSGSGTLSAFAR